LEITIPFFEPHRAIDQALVHAASVLALELEANWLPSESLDRSAGMSALSSYDGLWVAPGSPYRSIDGILGAIRFARESSLPLLGTCGGFQHIVLEYARNVLGFADAAHAEYDPYASKLFISQAACSLVGRELVVSLRPESLVARAYGTTVTSEPYYCNFVVNREYNSALAASDLAVVGSDSKGAIRVVKLRNHPFFVGTLFVPQLRSRIEAPHPLVVSFLNACVRVTATDVEA
jgi:CTP synthase (UTP-ammonia lyase)